jgi:predicted outer membrane repeat protein
MLKTRKFAMVILLVLLVAGVQSATMQVASIAVSLPVHGYYVFSGDLPDTANQVLLVDTFSGSVTVLTQEERGTNTPVFDPRGERVAYSARLTTSIINLATGNHIDVPSLQGELYVPQGWSPDGNRFLYLSFGYTPNNEGVYKLGILDITTGAPTLLFMYQVDQPITNLPLPPLPSGVTHILMLEINAAYWNPVYPEWIAIEIVGYTPDVIVGDGQYAGAAGVSFTFLYNLPTGQMLSLDQLFAGQISPDQTRWSPDGKYLVVQTNEDMGGITNIVAFNPTGDVGSLSVIASAPSEYQVIVDWLGAGDLLHTAIRDSATGDAIHYIAQIVDGVWYSTEFFRLPQSFSAQAGGGGQDWHITASESEKQVLTCLFDQTLPARLQLGLRARVAFTDGTASRLRAEPNTQATEVTLMPEGTEFNLIGGPMCANSYRWWQLQLDDGTTGWAAEASNTDYFIEPLPQATLAPTSTPTNAPTDTATFVPSNTPTETPTATPSPTATFTPTETPTFTLTPTWTFTPTPSVVCTITVSAADTVGLVNAINAANGNGASADTICLTAGSAYTFTNASSGIALPSVTTPITIIGNGAIIERGGGAPNFRLFNVTASGSLTLSNLTIRNFNAGGGNGGAILNTGTVTFEGVTLTGNTARFAGGIYSSGTLTITNSTLSSNSSQEDAGAIYLNSGSLSITDTTFESNSARYGSGIYLYSGTASLTNVTMRSNSANEQGAGIYQRSGSLTVTGGLFESNTARYGNSIYVDGGTATISDVTLRSNNATEEGGGIYARTGTITVTGSTFENNRARYGAAISNGATLSVSDSVFTGNTATESGGAINNRTSGAHVVQNSCFSGNTARFGGTVFSSTGNFDARNNWWGAESGPTSVMVNSNVLFSPFLTTGCPNE